MRLISSCKAKNFRINIHSVFSYLYYHWPAFHWGIGTKFSSQISMPVATSISHNTRMSHGSEFYLMMHLTLIN